MATDPSPKPAAVEFIPAETDEKQLDDTAPRVIEREPWEETLTHLANRDTRRISIPRSPDIKRNQVVSAFHDAFQLMGGVPRLTLWADENPGEFYKLYGKLLPRQVDQDIKHDGGMTIRHVLPRGKLDE